MEQVLHNLILNATQHAPDGSNISLKVGIKKEQICIEVADEGPGFPEDELSHLFEKFYRGKDAKAGGTGLGLSIVKGFVEAQKATISAYNAINGGAVFTITLPTIQNT